MRCISSPFFRSLMVARYESISRPTISFLIALLMAFSASPMVIHAAPTAHDNIKIHGDSELTPANGVSSGSGTQWDPYIIEDLEITGPGLRAIEIAHTSKHLLIRNVVIRNTYGADYGIDLTWVRNCVIENVTTHDLNVTYHFAWSSFVTIKDCVSRGGEVQLWKCDNITIDGYRRTRGPDTGYDDGIFVDAGSDVDLVDCYISDVDDHGIYLQGTHGVDVRGCSIVSAGQIGIFVKAFDDRVVRDYNIEGNTILAGGFGIHLNDIVGMKVEGNNLIDTGSYGLSIYRCNDHIIRDNTFTNQGIAFPGRIPHSGAIFVNNTVDGRPIVYLEGISDTIIDGDIGQLLVLDATNCTVRNLTCKATLFVRFSNHITIDNCSFVDASSGISLYYTNKTTIRRSTFEDCITGASNFNSDHIVVDNCTFSGFKLGISADCTFSVPGQVRDHTYQYNVFRRSAEDCWFAIRLNHAVLGRVMWNDISGVKGDGIVVSDSRNVKVQHNTVSDCTRDGIRTVVSTGPYIVCDNTVKNTTVGLSISGSVEKQVFGNNVDGCHETGIMMDYSSNSIVIFNRVSDSTDHGLVIGGSSNLIHHNMFIANNQAGVGPLPPQVTDESDGTNKWDDGYGQGNYWSDYEARYPAASSSNGVWSIPYEVETESSQIELYDRWPLSIELDLERPEADAGEDIEVYMGERFHLDGTGSTDNDEVFSYVWFIWMGDIAHTLTGPQPSFTIDEAGVYDVQLIVKDHYDNSDVDWMTVTVIDPDYPVAEAGENITVDQFGIATFDGSGCIDGGGIVNFTWTVTMGGTEHVLYGTSPTLECDLPGVFDVTLWITDTDGHSANDTMVLVVRDTIPPVAVAGEDVEASQFEAVTFDGSSSHDNVGIVSYKWSIEDGEDVVTIEDVIGSHTFERAGIYIVTLLVTDAMGNEGSGALNVTVLDAEPPKAVPGPDTSVDQFKPMELDGSASQDNVGIVNFTWTVELGDVELVLYGRMANVTFNEVGNYSITLTVKDAVGLVSSGVLNVLVMDKSPPTVDLGGNRTVFVGEPVPLDGDDSADNVGVVEFMWTIQWYDGDHTLEGKSTTLTYEKPGAYRVQLEVKDANGNTGLDSIFIYVIEREEGPEEDGGLSIWLVVVIIIVLVIAVLLISVYLLPRRGRSDNESEERY